MGIFGAVGDGVAVGGAIGFIGIVATYAIIIIRRGDAKEAAAYNEMRTERDFWRSIALTGKAPTNAPDYLKALAPPDKEPTDDALE